MSKITNDGLTRSGTGCFIAVLVLQQWASELRFQTDLFHICTYSSALPHVIDWKIVGSHVCTCCMVDRLNDDHWLLRSFCCWTKLRTGNCPIRHWI